MDKKGFTLQELLLTVIFMVIVLLVSVQSFTAMFRYYSAIKDSMSLEMEANILCRRIANDIQQSSRYGVLIEKNTPNAGSDRITFYLPLMVDTDLDGVSDTPQIISGAIQMQEEPVVIELDEETGELIRKQGDGSYVLADNVTKINFYNIADDPGLYIDEVQVVLQMESGRLLGRSYSVNSITNLNMRNSG